VLLRKVQFSRVDGREGYAFEGTKGNYINFIFDDSLVLTDGGDQVRTDAMLVTAEVLDRGSFWEIEQDENAVYKVEGISRGLAGLNRYKLKRVGEL
jgi:hypothetical protein